MRSRLQPQAKKLLTEIVDRARFLQDYAPSLHSFETSAR